MKHEMLKPVYNQPLDRKIETGPGNEKSRRIRSWGATGAALAATGVALVSYENSQPAETLQTEITHTVESGETVQDILKNVCSTNSEADLLALQREVGIDIKATNPANPQISAGETFTVTVPTELCHPDQS